MDPEKPLDLSGIEVLDALEAVRRRPTMYVGELDREGLTIELLRQALCHALDEVADGNCSEIDISILNRTITVTYNAGLSLEIQALGDTQAVRILSHIHACSNLKKHTEVGDKHCTLGIAVLNAFSRTLEATTISNGQKAEFLFRQGRLINPHATLEAKELDQTEITFLLDSDILGENVKFDHEDIKALLVEVSDDFKGLTVSFTTREYV